MASLASRRYFGSSTTTTTTAETSPKWDPEDVLQLCSDSRCVGYAPSRRRKCLMPIRQDNVMALDSIVEEMALQQPDAKKLRPTLVRLAEHRLCVRFHQYQVEDMVEKWSRRITAAYPAPRQLARGLRTRHEEEVAALQERIREMERRFDLLQAAVPVSPSSSRVSASNISSLRLPRTTTATSNAAFNTRATPAAPAPPPIVSTSPRLTSVSSPARRTVSPTSPVPRLASPFSPRPSQPRHTISTPPTTVAPATPTTRSPSPTLTTRSELLLAALPPRTIVLPSPTTSITPSPRSNTPIDRCTRTHVRRLPYDDECPICYEGDDLRDLDASEIVWCKSSCGRSIHKSCFEGWRIQCESAVDRTVNCPVCRIDWKDDCGCLGCPTRHAEKRVVEGDCSICCQRMGHDDDDDEEEDEEEEDLVWCKDGCGQSVHKDCFKAWKSECESNSREATCVVCRAEWKDECRC